MLLLFFVLLCQRVKSSRSQMLFKIGVLKNFPIFTGKHLCWSLFFNKVAGLRPRILLKKRLQHSCFPLNFAKFLRTPFYTEQPRWLLLEIDICSRLSCQVNLVNPNFLTPQEIKTLSAFSLQQVKSRNYVPPSASLACVGNTVNLLVF